MKVFNMHIKKLGLFFLLLGGLCNSSMSLKASNNAQFSVFNTLPDEIKQLIISFLPIKDIANVSALNSDFNRLVNDNNLWKTIYHNVAQNFEANDNFFVKNSPTFNTHYTNNTENYNKYYHIVKDLIKIRAEVYNNNKDKVTNEDEAFKEKMNNICIAGNMGDESARNYILESLVKGENGYTKNLETEKEAVELARKWKEIPALKKIASAGKPNCQLLLRIARLEKSNNKK